MLYCFSLCWHFLSVPLPLSLFYAIYNPILVNQLPCIVSFEKNDFLPFMVKVWFSYKATKHHLLRRTWKCYPSLPVLGSPGGTGPRLVPTTVLRLHILILLSLNSCQNLVWAPDLLFPRACSVSPVPKSMLSSIEFFIPLPSCILFLVYDPASRQWTFKENGLLSFSPIWILGVGGRICLLEDSCSLI